MKASSVLIAVFIAAIFSGCSTQQSKSDHVTLIEVDSGKLLLAITKSQWGGILGPHGYVGSERVGYWAALEGSGPVFTNPHFQDDPADFRCVGTITLDREHGKVPRPGEDVLAALPTRATRALMNGNHTALFNAEADDAGGGRQP